jgi:transposase InsO family protein
VEIEEILLISWVALYALVSVWRRGEREKHTRLLASHEFDLFCAEYGIIHKRTSPYSPQSNGVAERKNRTLTDLVNSILKTAGLSKA